MFLINGEPVIILNIRFERLTFILVTKGKYYNHSFILKNINFINRKEEEKVTFNILLFKIKTNLKPIIIHIVIPMFILSIIPFNKLVK